MNIKYFYVRDEKKNPVACLAFQRQRKENGEYYVSAGISIRNPNDKFNRKIARGLAQGRAGTEDTKLFAMVQPKKFTEQVKTAMQVILYSKLPTRVREAAAHWINNPPEDWGSVNWGSVNCVSSSTINPEL